MIPLGETLWITPLNVSDIYRSPAASIATSRGPFGAAPATVLSILAGETLRTRLFLKSALYKFEFASTQIPNGLFNWTFVATPSPLKPPTPVPATVLISPAGVIFRTRWLKASAMYRLPELSKVIPAGEKRYADVAGP